MVRKHHSQCGDAAYHKQKGHGKVPFSIHLHETGELPLFCRIASFIHAILFFQQGVGVPDQK